MPRVFPAAAAATGAAALAAACSFSCSSSDSGGFAYGSEGSAEPPGDAAGPRPTQDGATSGSGQTDATRPAATEAGGADTASPFPQGHPPLQRQPANVVGGFSIDFADPSLQPIVVQPGGELWPCVVFPLVITGPSTIVGGGLLYPPPAGLHHGNITTRPSDGTNSIHPCPNVSWTTGTIGEEALDVLAGGAVIFGSTTQIRVEEWQSFPDGMGYRITSGYQVIAHMHFLNPTAQAVTVAPKYQWYTIDESKVTQQLFPFIWRMTNFTVPPNTQQSFVGACNFTGPMHIVNVLPHMHQLGVGLDAAFLGGPLDGQTWRLKRPLVS